MKMWICSLMLTVLTGNFSFAAAPPDPTAQTQAVERWPQLAQSGSSFNKRFVARVNTFRTAQDPVLERGDWPLIIANQIGAEMGVTPTMPTSLTDTEAAQPKKKFNPSSTMLDSPGSTALTRPGQAVGSNPLTVAPGLKTINGSVLQRLSDGLIIQTRMKGDGGKIFLTGLDKKTGDKVSAPALKVGTYNYQAVSGAEVTIDAYEVIK